MSNGVCTTESLECELTSIQLRCGSVENITGYLRINLGYEGWDALYTHDIQVSPIRNCSADRNGRWISASQVKEISRT